MKLTKNKLLIVFSTLFALCLAIFCITLIGNQGTVKADSICDMPIEDGEMSGVGEEEIIPGSGSLTWSIDKVDSPITGRTSWVNESRPLGFVIYLNDVTFEINQSKLENKMTTTSLAKITFTRGEKTATPVLICASRDGGYASKSFFAFFFGGDLLGETINEYQQGDTFKIDQGCVLRCNQGFFQVEESLKYVYDGAQWTIGDNVQEEPNDGPIIDEEPETPDKPSDSLKDNEKNQDKSLNLSSPIFSLSGILILFAFVIFVCYKLKRKK